MKITKFRAISLIAILSCTTAWTVSLRSRSSREHLVERSSQSEHQVDDSIAANDDQSVQQASASLSSSDGVVLLSSENDDALKTLGTNENSGAQNSNEEPAENRSTASDVPAKPPKRKQVVDLRDRIASNATAVLGAEVRDAQGRGTEAHSTSVTLSESPQQGSPAWVDSTIPQELFDRANVTPRGQSPAAASVSPQTNPQTSQQITPQYTPQTTQQPTTQATPSTQAPSAPAPSAAPSNLATPPSSATQPSASTTSIIQQAQQLQRAQQQQQFGTRSVQAPNASVPAQQNRVPGATYTPDQAIPQWVNPNSTPLPNTSTKTNAEPARRSDPSSGAINLPPPTEPNERPANTPVESQPQPTSADSKQASPRATESREVPSGLKLTPGQIIPDWIYIQAGEKPPVDPRGANPQTTSPNSSSTNGQQASPVDLPPPSPARGAPSDSRPADVAPSNVAPTNIPPVNSAIVPESIDAPRSLSEPSISNQAAPNVPPTNLQDTPQIAPPNPYTPSQNGLSNNATNSAIAANPSTEKQGEAAKTSNVPLFYHPEQQHPEIDPSSCRVGYSAGDFSAEGGPQYHTFDPCAAAHVYRGKFAITTQRPLVELWRPLYTGGVYAPAPTWFGVTNPMKPHFMVYGDARTAVGINQNAQGKSHIWSNVLNLDMDLQLTSTERIHAFVSPLNRATKASGLSFNDEVEFIDGTNFNFNTLFFEGDAGALLGGANGTYPPFDLPFTFGLIPLVYQNGIWANDAALGAAMALPAKNSSFLKWSNFDASVFWATDNVTTDAFRGQDHAADFFGTAWFIDAYDGYIEADYAFVNDNTGSDRGYHNISMAFTRRYFMRLSNSIRYIVNAGQTDLAKANRTADGQLLLIENSFITAYPNTVVPYFNMFYGQGRPQSLARAGIAGGILTNTGINFETDGMTNYPTLDATGSNTAGFAAGVNLLASQFRHQLVLEFAMLQALGSRSLRNAAGDEYGLGVRYQKPLSNNLIFRTDHMVGLRDEATNIAGSRFELRWKF